MSERMLSITLNDDAKTITVTNSRAFSVIELLGMAEFLRIGTTDGILRDVDATPDAAQQPGADAEVRK